MSPVAEPEVRSRPVTRDVYGALPSPVIIFAGPTSVGADALVARLLAACMQAGRPAELARSVAFEAAGIVIDLAGSYRARDGEEVWRLRAGQGALFGRLSLTAVWHRSPCWVSVSLVRVARDGSSERASGHQSLAGAEETIAEAQIRSLGSLADFREKVAATAAILVRGAVSGGAVSVVPASAEPVEARTPRDGLLALAGGWLRWQAARWHARLFAEWWTIGICDRSIQAILRDGDLGSVRWLQPTRGEAYWADPFPWPGTADILVEECPIEGTPGRLVVLSQSPSGAWRRDRVLPGDTMHRSYPSTFAEGGQIYLLPECLGGGDVVLYRLVAPGCLTHVATIAHTPLADATLFRHDGRYWVAGTDVAIGAHDNLCLFHADRLEGPWRPHPGNPVKIDVRSARPAGTPFELDGRLYRPAQDCARAYGAAVVVNEVVTLTPERFVERAALRLAPDRFGPLPDGLHTLSAAGPNTLVDGKRMVVTPGLAARRVLRRLSRPTRQRRRAAPGAFDAIGHGRPGA